MAKLPALQSVRIGVKAAVLEMASNRFRSFLTLFGVALSVGAMTAMVSIQAGTRRNMETTVSEMGGLGRMAMREESPENLSKELVFSRSQGLRLQEADSINEGMDTNVRASFVTQQRMGVTYLAQRDRTPVRGVDRQALEKDEKIIPDLGRFFDNAEYTRGGKVAVVGWKVVERLREIRRSRHLDPDSIVGQTLDLAGVPYRIVGSFTKEYRRWDRPGYAIYIPLKAMLRDFTGTNPQVDWMNLEVVHPAGAEAKSGEISAFMRGLHRGAPDVGFRFFEWIGEYQDMMTNLGLVFVAVAGIAFLVGGVNILNVMLSTVSERIQEIGVRKALGATSPQIFLQFLVEAVTLSLCGGMIGAAIGSAPLLLADSIEAATHGIRPLLDAGAFAFILGLSVSMGVLSGLYPAVKAARLNPIEALHYE